ncbi:MAG TPA: BsaWI family type II restriction enzyme [Dehalococcoidales bacterium]
MDDSIAETVEEEHSKSWDNFLFKNFKPFVTYVLRREVPALGLKFAEIGKFRGKRNKHISLETDSVLRHILVDYGEAMLIPDVDMAFYRPKSFDVLAVCIIRPVSKTSVIDAMYWKTKLLESELTSHIKLLFITLRESSFLRSEAYFSLIKAKAVLSQNVDCLYMLSEDTIEETENIKSFDKFFPDLKALVKQ